MGARNLSPWAYWQLHLASAEAIDPCPLGDSGALEAWRGRVRARVAEGLGPDPQEVPLDLEVVARVDGDAYTREEIVFDSEAAMSVPASLLIPHGRTAPGPAVLAVHGHGAGRTMVCGIDGGDAARRAEIEAYNGGYADALARLGYVVLAPDLRGFGARADWQPPDRYGCDWNLVCALAAGRNPLGQNVWDLRRCLDVLAAHPLVAADRIGAAGLSYGATTTLFVAALDERVRAAVVSGYLSSWQAAHRVPWNMCGSQVIPGMLGTIEHLDIASLIAPRALLVESGTGDLIFPVEAARATVGALATVYEHLGARGALEHDVFEGDHRWHGARVASFLARHLGGAQ